MGNSITVTKAADSVRVDLAPSAARIISGTSPSSAGLVGVEAFTSADVALLVTAATGTSPTLDVYIQKLLPDGATWVDLIHFTQATGAVVRWVSVVGTAMSADIAVQDAALTVATVRAALLGSVWRVKYVIGGTNPSFTFQVGAEFYA